MEIVNPSISPSNLKSNMVGAIRKKMMTVILRCSKLENISNRSRERPKIEWLDDMRKREALIKMRINLKRIIGDR